MEQTEQGLFFPLGLDLSGLRTDFREATNLGRTFGTTLSRAFSDVAVKGKSLSSVMRSVLLSLSKSALSSALRPAGNGLDGFFGQVLGSAFGGGNGLSASSGGLFANGGAFVNGVQRFANGGIVSNPSLFPMSGGGLGVMGEAGPEAIMPLARGNDGKLGVRAPQAGQAITINFNVTAPNPEAFVQSQGQITAMMGRALNGARRNS